MFQSRFAVLPGNVAGAYPGTGLGLMFEGSHPAN